MRSRAHKSRMMPRPTVSETSPMKLKSMAMSAAMMPATTSQSMRSRRRSGTAALLGGENHGDASCTANGGRMPAAPRDAIAKP